MKIFLATLGSRGDYEPFFNLALEAKNLGHEVVLAATEDFTETTKAAGIKPLELRGTMKDLIQDTGVSPAAAMKQFKSVIKPLMLEAFDRVVNSVLTEQPDAVVYHPKVLAAPIAARKVGAKSFVVELAPLMTPTKEFAAAGVSGFTLGPFNRLSYSLVAQSAALFKIEINSLSHKLDVADSKHDFALCAVSPSLIDRPSDWPETAHIVGQWTGSTLPSKASKDLERFLNKPTAYFGFGSMVAGDAASRTQICIEAARSVGLQALIVGGWGGLAKPVAADDVLFAESVDHASVFPNVAVAVHHGGAGTTHAAARAGTPSVIIPFFADQPWWGNLLFSKGLSPKPIPVNKVTAAKLTKALNQAMQLTPALRDVSRKMQFEKATLHTIELIKGLV